MKFVYICSPLSGDIENNIKKAIGYCKEAYECGYIPLAPHIYFTLFLDDTKEKDRKIGMEQGMKWLEMSDELWQFGEPSKGMKAEIKWWKENTNRPIVRFER